MKEQPSDKKPVRRRRIRWVVLAIFVVLLALPGLLYGLRGVLLAPYLQRLGQELLETHLGLEVSIGAIQGTYVTRLVIQDVTTLSPNPSGPVSSLAFRRLQATYQPLSLLKGLDSFLAGVTLFLDGARVSLDLSHPSEPDEPETSPPSDPLVFLPEQLPRILVQDAAISVQGPDYSTSLVGLELRSRPRQPPGTILELFVSEIEWAHPEIREGTTALAAEIHYGREGLAVQGLMLGEHRLVDHVRVGFEGLPKTIPFEAHLLPAGGELILKGALDGDVLNARLQAHDLDLAVATSLLKEPPLPALAGRLSLGVEASLPLEDVMALTADLELSLKGAGALDLHADDIQLLARAGNGQIQILRLGVETGANRILLEQVQAPMVPLLEAHVDLLLDTIEGHFDLNCKDLPALLALAGLALPQGMGDIPDHQLLLEGQIQEGRINLVQGRLQAGSGQLTLPSLNMVFPQKDHPFLDTVLETRLDLDFPDLRLLGQILPILPPIGGALQGHAHLSGTLGAPTGSLSLSGRNIHWEGLEVDLLEVKARSDMQRAVLESLVVRRGDDRVDGQGAFQMENMAFEDVRVAFGLSDPMFYLERLWPHILDDPAKPINVQGSLSGELQVSGSIEDPAGSLAFQATDLWVHHTPVGRINLQVEGDLRTLTINTLDIRQQQDHVALSGSLSLGSLDLEDVNLDLSLENVGAYVDHLLPDLALSGAVQGSIQASGPLLAPDGEVEVSVKGFRMGDLDLPLARLKASSAGRSLSLQEVEIHAPPVQTRIAGRLDRGPDDLEGVLHLEKWTLTGEQPFFSLQHPAPIRYSREGSISIEDLVLSGPSGTLRMTGSGEIDGHLDLRLSLEGLKSEGWLDELVTDSLEFEGLTLALHAWGGLESPEVDLKGNLGSLRIKDVPLSLSGRFDLGYGEQGVTIRELSWWKGEGDHIRVQGSIPISLTGPPTPLPDPLSLEAAVSLSDLGLLEKTSPEDLRPGGSFEARLNLSGTWDDPSGSLNFQLRHVQAPERIQPQPPGPLDVDGRIRLDGTRLSLETLQGFSPTINLSCRGYWDGLPPVRSLLEGPLPDLSGKVSFSGDLSISDLGWLASEATGLRRVLGRLETSIRMEGSLPEPDVHADIRLSDVEIRPDMDLPSLQDIQVNLRVTPEQVRIQTFKGQLGGAPFEVQGEVRLRNGEDIITDIRLLGKDLLFFRDQGIRVRADTDITVQGPLSQLQLGGEVALTDGHFVQYFDFLKVIRGSEKPKKEADLGLFSIRDAPLKDALFNIRITAKNPFLIRNNVLTGSARPDLRLAGTGELPILTGMVYVDRSRITLPAGNLIIESGVIRFDKDSPDRPVLDILGSARMAGYDITILVQGPVDEPVVTLSSIPPVSNESLLRLVLTGQRPRVRGERRDGGGQNLGVMVYVGRDLLARWFGNETGAVDDESLLDRFDIDIGRSVTQKGDETIETRFRLAEEILLAGDTLYVTGEKDEYDYYNAGVRFVFRFK